MKYLRASIVCVAATFIVVALVTTLGIVPQHIALASLEGGLDFSDKDVGLDFRTVNCDAGGVIYNKSDYVISIHGDTETYDSAYSTVRPDENSRDHSAICDVDRFTVNKKFSVNGLVRNPGQWQKIHNYTQVVCKNGWWWTSVKVRCNY